ncbi:glycine zipper domain-containing protein [Paranoxybacillus vitaminiphilus]|nr:hypothetical protein [Anoxybacillus vitaminiphilus]
MNAMRTEEFEYTQILPEDEAKELQIFQQKFIESYINHKDKMDVEEWLRVELKNNLPEKTDTEIEKISKEIVETLKVNETSKMSLQEAIKNGRSKESWFANQLKQSTSHLSTAQTAEYLHTLDEAMKNANQSMYNTIITKNGTINQNLNLDGFIAEQHHVNSFNLKAAVKGSEYRAEVLLPKDGQTYGKNSVDIVIKDRTGKIVERYQAKYGKTAEDTIRMINEGNYNNQRLLVPAEQVEEVQKAFPNKTVVASIGSGEIKSEPLEKIRAKELQKEAQSGRWNDLNWNEYKNKDLAIGIGKQAGYAAIQGAAIGAGIELAKKVCNGEEIKSEEIVEQVLMSGADFGIKAATAGALKVAVEKGVVTVIPKGTPAGTIANIAYIAIENIKILGKVATGEMTIREGFEKIEQTTVATVAGIAASTEGALIGATVGSVFGPVGAAVGSFIGGTVGYIAGSKVGETIVKTHQKIRNKAREIVKEVGSTVASEVKNTWNSVKSFASRWFAR